MNRSKESYFSLLHLIEDSDLDRLDNKLIEEYSKEWQRQWEKGNTAISEKFNNKENLLAAINDLLTSIPEQKFLFQNKNLLAFLESGMIGTGLVEEIGSVAQYMGNPKIAQTVQNAFIYCFETKVFETGIRNIQFLKEIKDPFLRLPPEIQDKIEIRTKKIIKHHFQVLETSIDLDELQGCDKYVSPHIKNAITKLPFENNEVLNLYGKRCEYLVEKNLNRLQKKELNVEERDVVITAASVAGNILNDKDLTAIGKTTSKIYPAGEKRPGRKLLFTASWIIALAVIGYGVYKLVPLIQDETKTSAESYEENVKESTSFYRNRYLSLKDVEQRKSTEIVESYQYGERENVPLFYTYVKTNKYLDINEVDSELFKLKRNINVEGIETPKIFALVHFYIHDKDAPYRSVMAEYSNIQRDIKYKQVLNTRAAKKLDIHSWDNNLHKIAIEVKDEYPNGVTELSVFEAQINPEKDNVKLYGFDPMPAVIDSMTLDDYKGIILSENVSGSKEVLGMIRLVQEIVEAKSFRYRIPNNMQGIQYNVDTSPVSPMYNWELTTSDDLAFIRIRSDDVKGYYLVDRFSGLVKQAKASFNIKDKVRRSYTFNFDYLEEI